MASQHPDHANKPYWHDQALIRVSDEYTECYQMFADLGIDEYKWDWEGKLVDESVMERLLGEHYEYFKINQLGRDKFLTFRLPNPKVETEFRIGRSFINILSAATMGKQFGFAKAPLFEVILPMTESAQEMIAIQEAFAEMSGLKHKLYRLEKNMLSTLEIIPLFEQTQTIINSDRILEEYIALHKKHFGKKPSYLRPYVARSDPALNAGMVPTVIAIKIALSKYSDFAQKHTIPLYPIIGSASLPFRGGLTPPDVESFINEYKGIRTALIQSGFRYDYPKKQVKDAIEKLNTLLPKQEAQKVNEKDTQELVHLMQYFETYYQKTVEDIAPLINQLASFLPKRRERVQHIGLFGYSRGVGKVSLPRAIGFTGALYSIGIPPELIGTGRGLRVAKLLKKQELIEKYYLNIRKDLERAGRYLNKDNLAKLVQKSPDWGNILSDVEAIENYLGKQLSPQTKDEKAHQKLTSKIYKDLEEGGEIQKPIEQAAILRKSLG